MPIGIRPGLDFDFYSRATLAYSWLVVDRTV